MKILNKILIIISLIMLLMIIACSSFDSTKLKINATGFEFKKADINVSYDSPLFTCKYEENEEYHYNGQEITITCRSNIIPGFKTISKEEVKTLYYTHYGSICAITKRWVNAGIPDKIVAIYQKTSSDKTENDYIIVVETDNGYKSYIEKNLFSYTNEEGFHEYVNVLNGVVINDVEIKEYKNIDNLQSFINEISNDNYKVLIESYNSPLYTKMC